VTEPHRDLLGQIDAYLDSVPRRVVRTEEIGPFTLFVNEGNGWRYYARPTPGATSFTRDDVATVRARQRALRQPEEVEWLVDVAPGVAEAAEGAGMRVRLHPLMHLPMNGLRPAPVPDGAEVTFAPAEADLARITGVAHVGFATPGAGTGAADDARALDDATRDADAQIIDFTRGRIRDGFTMLCAAWTDAGPVAVGSYQPLDGVAEVTGVATLPSHRRRGFGAAVTSALVTHALAHGVHTVFLSANDAVVARVYGGVGFRIVGAAGAASKEDG
jgi:GNAT superfamily N-acetyltransferase